jgi:hypothetical protein
MVTVTATATTPGLVLTVQALALALVRVTARDRDTVTEATKEARAISGPAVRGLVAMAQALLPRLAIPTVPPMRSALEENALPFPILCLVVLLLVSPVARPKNAQRALPALMIAASQSMILSTVVVQTVPSTMLASTMLACLSVIQPTAVVRFVPVMRSAWVRLALRTQAWPAASALYALLDRGVWQVIVLRLDPVLMVTLRAMVADLVMMAMETETETETEMVMGMQILPISHH